MSGMISLMTLAGLPDAVCFNSLTTFDISVSEVSLRASVCCTGLAR